MKKYILIILILISSACSTSDVSTDKSNNPTFSVDLSGDSTALVDETIAIDITGNENIMTLLASLDNFQTTVLNQTISPQGFGTVTKLYFSFDDLGSKTIYIKAINNMGDESIKTFNVTVSRGNAIKIMSVQVVSFSNIDNTWDPEFPDTDANRLADVGFLLRKPKAGVTENSFNFKDWFRSAVKQNQGDLTWDLSSENLYLNPQFSLQYSMADDDGGGIGQDLMLGPPFEREITFQEHIATKPNVVSLKVPEIDLEVAFTIEWPN